MTRPDLDGVSEGVLVPVTSTSLSELVLDDEGSDNFEGVGEEDFDEPFFSSSSSAALKVFLMTLPDFSGVSEGVTSTSISELVSDEVGTEDFEGVGDADLDKLFLSSSSSAALKVFLMILPDFEGVVVVERSMSFSELSLDNCTIDDLEGVGDGDLDDDVQDFFCALSDAAALKVFFMTRPDLVGVGARVKSPS